MIAFIFFFFHIVPSSPPQNVSVSFISSSSIFVQWNPPPKDKQNGVIKYYSVLIEELFSNTTFNYNTTGLYITIEDLHPFYVYEFNVVAVTIGNGPVAANTFQMPEDGEI